MHPQFASIDGSPSLRQRDIYLLSPRLLPPEVIAVAFAKTIEAVRDVAGGRLDPPPEIIRGLLP